jgi:hypothetical protein
MDIVLSLLILIQVEMIIIISFLIYHVLYSHFHYSKHTKKDKLIRHIKEYISEGYTLKEVREKLEKIGFSETRINKLLQDFLRD